MSYYSLRSFCILITASLLLILSACRQESSGKATLPNTRFFDLKAYFQQESAALATQAPQVRKRLEVDGRVEEQTLSKLDYQQELRLFSDADINRPAWLDKYAVDSLLQNGRLSHLSYRALESGLKTRELQIDFEDGQVSQIYIHKQFDTAIASTEQKLTYAPRKGYSIDSRQKTVLQDPQVFKVEAVLTF